MIRGDLHSTGRRFEPDTVHFYQYSEFLKRSSMRHAYSTIVFYYSFGLNDGGKVYYLAPADFQ